MLGMYLSIPNSQTPALYANGIKSRSHPCMPMPNVHVSARLCFDLLSILLSNNFSLSPALGPDPILSLSNLRLPIQITEVSLPSNRNKPSEYTPILRIDKRKAERRNRWPKFAAIDHRNRYRPLDPIPHFRERVAGEERLHAEEIRVEYGCEADLVNRHLRNQRKDFARIVEIVS